MNDLEARLRHALDGAVPHRAVAPDVLLAAAGRARRIRRRRVATRGAVGAAAVLTSGAVAWRGVPPAADRTTSPSASASVTPAASSPAAAPAGTLRVTVSRGACREATPRAGVECVRTAFVIHRDGVRQGHDGAVENGRVIEDRGDREWLAPPTTVRVDLVDGTSRVVAFRATGENEWTADVPIPAEADVTIVTVGSRGSGHSYRVVFDGD